MDKAAVDRAISGCSPTAQAFEVFESAVLRFGPGSGQRLSFPCPSG